MKSGIALMLSAIEALQAWHGGLARPVSVFLVSDEASFITGHALVIDGGQTIDA